MLMRMGNFSAYIVDGQGAFLHGGFDNGEELYCKISEGFEKLYDLAIYC